MEWPELIEEFLPEETIDVHIEEIEGGKRRVTVG
jgi:tRNA A37 threonylcarbamoyladenosine biosynthesis protein TsaE